MNRPNNKLDHIMPLLIIYYYLIDQPHSITLVLHPRSLHLVGLITNHLHGTSTYILCIQKFRFQLDR